MAVAIMVLQNTLKMEEKRSVSIPVMNLTIDLSLTAIWLQQIK